MDMMVDIETLDTLPTAVIVSIGAVMFDPMVKTHLPPADTFYHQIDVGSALSHGLTVSGSTIAWWMQQSDPARKVFQEGHPLILVLQCFHLWVSRRSPRAVWCHGPAFDGVILENAFRATGVTCPWSYRALRCTRTAYELGGVDLAKFNVGTTHNALDDAMAQVKALQHAIAVIRS